jgi:UDP-N-acetylmuramate--alanine ligase
VYKKQSHIHFVGIGGIGMSGIATILKYQNYQISGCDLDLSQKSIQHLQSLGCLISEGQNSHTCQDKSIDVLVYSSAVKPNSLEIVAAQKRGIPIIPRALMLAELMRTKYSIAISGSHGKTTTTSMISHILMEARMDPTIIIGGHLKSISNNAKFGLGEFLVAEADESDRSLTHLHATIAVLTNIDLEHLETYKDFEDIKETFKKFLNNIPFYGKAIVCIEDPGVQEILPIPHLKIIKYGLNNKANIWADEINLEASHSTFNVYQENKLLGKINLNMPGKHNVLNALGAITLALDLDLSFEIIYKALKNFNGVERRFTFHGTTQSGAEVFDDYGHHPNEILNTLLVARKRSKKQLRVIFQPHRYTRTQQLWQQFIDVFKNNPVDELLITDIYPASEKPIENITSENFVIEFLKQNPKFPIKYIPFDKTLENFANHINKNAKQNDLVLLLGAGKLNLIAGKIILS